MPMTIACPNCDARLEAPDDIEGRKVQCKMCGEKFRARPVEEDDEDDRRDRRAGKSANKSRPRPAADDEDEDERPSRRAGKASRRREEDDRDEDEDRPRRRSRDEGDEEEEPQPRKKKGKKKKKSAPPLVLLISIGVGVLVLIAGIGAYYSLSGDKSDGSVTPGGPVSGPSTDPGGGSPAHPDLPGWVEFADPNGQFKVRLPRKPADPTKQSWPLPNGDAPEATIYTVEIGGGLWGVAHQVVPGREAGAPADPFLDEVISGGMGWFRGAVIKSRTNITHQKFPGRQAVLEYPGVKGTTVLRVILAGNRMFWVVARGENFTADNPKVRGFLDSLKIN